MKCCSLWATPRIHAIPSWGERILRHVFAQPGKKPHGPQMSDVRKLRGEAFCQLRLWLKRTKINLGWATDFWISICWMGSPSGNKLSKMPGRKMIVDVYEAHADFIDFSRLTDLCIYSCVLSIFQYLWKTDLRKLAEHLLAYFNHASKRRALHRPGTQVRMLGQRPRCKTSTASGTFGHLELNRLKMWETVLGTGFFSVESFKGKNVEGFWIWPFASNDEASFNELWKHMGKGCCAWHETPSSTERQSNLPNLCIKQVRNGLILRLETAETPGTPLCLLLFRFVLFNSPSELQASLSTSEGWYHAMILADPTE